MDPWADSTTAWVPEDKGRSTPPPSLLNESSNYTQGSIVDPWAEPSSSSTILVVSSQRRTSLSSREYVRETISGSEGDFDPWGGNTAPVAPLSTAYHSTIEDEEIESDAKEEQASPVGWSGSKEEEEDHPYSTQRREEDHPSSYTVENEPTEEPTTIADEDDPWGSGAAARRVKAQQEAESAAQRMEILRLQEEAKGKQMDEEGNSIEVKPEEKVDVKQASVAAKHNEEASASDAPAAAGWRSLFSRVAAKPATSADNKSADEKSKLDTNVAGRMSESKEPPHSSSTSVAAPRLWQAPNILGSHNRSSSTTSRSGSIKETSTSTPPSASKGPGWEVTTKKQQTGGGGGLIQSLFGVVSSANDNENSTTITATRKEDKTTGLNRFGRGLQPPSVVSAVDEEEDSFETEETGIEWESGDAFESKSKRDLLSDDADEKQTESTIKKLIGKLRARNTQAGRAPDDFSKADLSWLESVGANANSTQGSSGTDSKEDPDWLAFIEGKPSSSTASQQEVSLNRSSSNKYRISSTSKGSINSRIPPPLAPPPSSTSAPSPFSFRGPTSKSTSRVASQTSTKTTASLDAFEDFDTAYVDESPNPDEGYRDDVVDNALPKGHGRLEAAPKTNSFMKNFQSQSRYNYDEDEVDSHNDNWTAFRDNITGNSSQHRPYTDDQEIGSRSSMPSTVNSKPASKGLGVSSNNGILPPPPPSSNRPQTWDRNAPLQPPPGRSQPTAMAKILSQSIPTALPASKPKTLSRGKTLTNDDLSFFENL